MISNMKFPDTVMKTTTSGVILKSFIYIAA